MSSESSALPARPIQLVLLGFGGVFFGLLELGTALLGRAWVDEQRLPIERLDPMERTLEESQSLVVYTWLDLNLGAHLLLGVALVLSALGLLLMREWGRRGMVLHALLSGFWALGFALVSTTWVVATWDEGWEQADEGGAVNTGGLAAFWIDAGALIWLALVITVLWILSRPHTREILNRYDRGLGGPS